MNKEINEIIEDTEDIIETDNEKQPTHSNKFHENI